MNIDLLKKVGGTTFNFYFCGYNLGTSKLILKYLKFWNSKNVPQAPKDRHIALFFSLPKTFFEHQDFWLIQLLTGTLQTRLVGFQSGGLLKVSYFFCHSIISNQSSRFSAADLLGADEKKFLWALCNYCVIVKGSAVRNKQNVASAQEALRVLARGLYCRLVDFIVNIINLRISVTRVVL